MSVCNVRVAKMYLHFLTRKRSDVGMVIVIEVANQTELKWQKELVILLHYIDYTSPGDSLS